MMHDIKPTISIGLPVYNGEKYLSNAIDAILAQSFTDFELVISDNCSDDRTEDICRAYCARDKRIRYFRSEINRGASWNFNQAFKLSSGQYFMWAAHDDLRAAGYLETCLKPLEADSKLVLCYTATRLIDDNGALVREVPISENLESGKPHERFAAAWRYPPQIPVFGLIRSEQLVKTKLIGNYSSSDRTLVAELALLGPFHGIDTTLFEYRQHTDQSTSGQYATRRARRAWYDPANKGGISFPVMRLIREYSNLIYHAPINLNERIRCYLSLGRWIIRRRNKLLG